MAETRPCVHVYCQTLFFKQVRKVLWTRKAPTCLLTVLYAYGKPVFRELRTDNKTTKEQQLSPKIHL